MSSRQGRMAGKLREHTATPDDPALVLVVDELASLTAYCTDRDAKKRIEPPCPCCFPRAGRSAST